MFLSRPARRISAAILFTAGLLPQNPALADDSVAKPNAIELFGGTATWTSFMPSMYEPWNNDFTDIGIAAIGYSYRFGSINSITGLQLPDAIGNHFLIEGEVGTSRRFGNEELSEIWVAAYLRYDNFPWNNFVYTTIAVNTGVSYLSEDSAFEQERDGSEGSQILHYMGPEISIAAPDNKNAELFVRWHHRSGVFGLFDDVHAGSTFLTGGIRFRF